MEEYNSFLQGNWDMDRGQVPTISAALLLRFDVNKLGHRSGIVFCLHANCR